MTMNNEIIERPNVRTSMAPEEGHDQEHVVLRRTEEGTGGGGANLPRCEPFPLTIPDKVPPEFHSSPQIVIAHRGASAHLPEHSLEGYRLALELGADYIEPDLVSTKDKHLVAMHSLDLTMTTNVEEVFGASRNKTLSKYKQEITSLDDTATGYWVYDFTLEELKQLRLKQRLGGPEKNGRSQAFDGLFRIPSLTDILELLNDWNENVQPLWYHDNNIDNSNNDGNTKQPHRYPPPPRGLYAELKDFQWQMKDANINLIDVFFKEIQNDYPVWEKALLRHMCSTKRLREHEYKLPPLVMQSFEAAVLKNFTIRWDQLSSGKLSDVGKEGNATQPLSAAPDLTFEVPVDSSGNTARIPLPIPPTIVLANHETCLEEKFWVEMEKSYRKVITGIGPDKMCFFKHDEISGDGLRYDASVRERATEMDWLVHSWTERPEEAFFATTAKPEGKRRSLAQDLVPFANIFEEILFLKCTVGVHGVFSESVDVAVRAMGTPCPNTKHSGSGHSSPTPLAFDTSEIPLGPVAGFSFLSGILVALLLFKSCFGGRANNRSNNNNSDTSNQQPQRRRAPRIPGRRVSNLPPHQAVPTDAADDDNDVQMVVLDDTDREIL
jgi:glycerophosphoryl diester phosphodiesterase